MNEEVTTVVEEMEEIENTEVDTTEEVSDAEETETVCDERTLGAGDVLLGAAAIGIAGYAVGKGIEFVAKKIGSIPAVATVVNRTKETAAAVKERNAEKREARKSKKVKGTVAAVEPESPAEDESNPANKDVKKEEKKSKK